MLKLCAFAFGLLFFINSFEPAYSQKLAEEGPVRLLVIPEHPEVGTMQDGAVSVMSMPGLPLADAAQGEVLATLLRANPVSSLIAAPKNLDGSTGQLFMVIDLSLALDGVVGNDGAKVDPDYIVTIGAEAMPLVDFGARLVALVDAIAPGQRQIAFFRVKDPDGIFAANVMAFHSAIKASSFGMVVVSVGEISEACRPAVAPHLALLAGMADRQPFGDGNGISTAAEAEAWLARALARPGQRDPACRGPYSLIIRSSDDPAPPLALHEAGAMPPDLQSRVYRETFEAEFLLKSDNAAQIAGYLETCMLCPNEGLLTEMLRAIREFEVTHNLEAGIWEQIKDDERTDRLEVYLANCALCTYRADAGALIADLNAKAAARAAETAAFQHAKSSRDLAALRNYVTGCVACDHREEATAILAEIEADAAYQAERDALATALEYRDRLAIEAWLSTCQSCDGRADAEVALAAIVQDETLIGPCEAAAGVPAKGGPRQLKDIDIPTARAACDAALEVLPRHPLLVVLAGRIDQAEGRLDAARAAYEAGVAAGVPEAFGLAAYLRFSPPDGGAPDYEAAAELARSGAELGDWLSKEILMVSYSRALVAGNGPAEALVIARENAEEGNVAAQFFLGYFLLSGTGVEMDEAEAAIWLRKASDGGYVRANPFLAEILERGEVVAAAHEDAARLIWEALGDSDSVTVARLTDQLSERHPEVIRFIQQKLRDVGVYQGRVDGIAGPGTVRAVQAYIETLQDEG